MVEGESLQREALPSRMHNRKKSRDFSPWAICHPIQTAPQAVHDPASNPKPALLASCGPVRLADADRALDRRHGRCRTGRHHNPLDHVVVSARMGRRCLGRNFPLFQLPFRGSRSHTLPLTATTWALLDPLLGPNRAGALTSWSQIALFGGAVAWLAREIGLSRAGALAALLACFCQRYLFFGTGETSIVGISALPIPIGLIALIRLQKEPQARWLVWLPCAWGSSPLRILI